MLTFGFEEIISHNENFIYTSEHWYFKKLKEHVSIELKHINDIDCNYYYIVDMPIWNFLDRTNLENPKLSDKVINDINNKKCKLLFFYEFRAVETKAYEKWIKKYDLPEKSIVLVTGNYSLDKFYKDNKYITYFGYSIFEHIHYNDRNKQLNLPLIEFELISAITQKSNREKIFLNYNRRVVFHKIKIVYELYKANLIDKGLVSLSTIGEYTNHLEYFPKLFVDLLPFKVDELDANDIWDMAFDFNVDHYKNTYFSVVSESVSTVNGVFPTEKIWKAIMGLHPFVLVASPHFLKYLKSVGYKTFSNWIDESYDLELDETKRIEMVTEEVKKLSSKSHEELQQMLVEMLPILLYNLQHLKRRSVNRELQTQLEKEIS